MVVSRPATGPTSSSVDISGVSGAVPASVHSPDIDRPSVTLSGVSGLSGLQSKDLLLANLVRCSGTPSAALHSFGRSVHPLHSSTICGGSTASSSRTLHSADRGGSTLASSCTLHSADRVGSTASSSRTLHSADRGGSTLASSCTLHSADRGGSTASSSRTLYSADHGGSTLASSRTLHSADHGGSTASSSRTLHSADCGGSTASSSRTLHSVSVDGGSSPASFCSLHSDGVCGGLTFLDDFNAFGDGASPALSGVLSTGIGGGSSAVSSGNIHSADGG